MKIKRSWNTKKRGVIEFLFYGQNGRYIGVCLTFNIIEEGKNLLALEQSVREAAYLHLKVVIKKNLSDDLLNRYAPEEYWEKYFKCQSLIARKQIEDRVRRNVPTTLTMPYPLINEAAIVSS